MISGEEIRQIALEREQNAPEAMKNSYYYGFREGAKWAIKEYQSRMTEKMIN